jgi:starch phosphorylase
MKEEYYGRMIYLEDYNIDMARHMVQGVDVWLNTPRIPMEASGTSGMKACLNGSLHCSVPDGWWAEAYTPETGWSIGSGEVYADQDLQDQVEAKALYDLIENQITPLFYHRGEDDLPRRWTQVMKRSIALTGMEYNSHRMLADYTSRFYVPSMEYAGKLSENSFVGARDLARWKKRIRQHWDRIRITGVTAELPDDGCCSVGDIIPVTVSIEAPELEAADLAVEVQYGTAGRDGWIEDRTSVTLEQSSRNAESLDFSGSIECARSGNRGFTVRILPMHELCGRVIEPGLVHWWE